MIFIIGLPTVATVLHQTEKRYTLSLSGVIMCGTVTYAAINMVNGQYQVEIGVTNQGLMIKSDIDKRECKIDIQ